MTCSSSSRPVFFTILFFAVTVACSAQVDAQRADQEAAIEEAVNDLFDAMRAADSAGVRAAFHPDATLQSVTREDDGEGYMLGATPVEAFVQGVGGDHPVYDEQISDLQIQVDEGLATAWMNYSFYMGDEFSHCGVNAFQYVLTDEGWKILHVTDTRRKGCE